MAMHLWLALAKHFSNAVALIGNTNHHSFSGIVFLRKKKETQWWTFVAFTLLPHLILQCPVAL